MFACTVTHACHSSSGEARREDSLVPGSTTQRPCHNKTDNKTHSRGSIPMTIIIGVLLSLARVFTVFLCFLGLFFSDRKWMGSLNNLPCLLSRAGSKVPLCTVRLPCPSHFFLHAFHRYSSSCHRCLYRILTAAGGQPTPRHNFSPKRCPSANPQSPS